MNVAGGAYGWEKDKTLDSALIHAAGFPVIIPIIAMDILFPPSKR